jgi:peptidoglycan-N-acetylglucosamine deacetylase
MPLKIKIKVFGIIASYLAVWVFINQLFGVVAGLVYISIGIYFLYKIYPKFDLSPDIRFDNSKKLISLTFDDGPSKVFTENILSILKDKNITGSFFVLGNKAVSNVDIIKKAILQNCEIGAHTINHKKLHNASASELTIEIEPVIKLIENSYSELGKPSEFKKMFRAPHGFKNVTLKRYLKSNSIKLIPWTRGIWDTDAPGSKFLIEKATSKPRNNEIILLHDGLGLNEASKEQMEGVLEALPKIIDFYKSNGYTFVKVSEFIKRK